MAIQGPAPTRRPTSRPSDGKAGLWIQLEHAKSYYLPGDLIEGRTSLSLTKRAIAGTVSATFEGAINTCSESKDPEVGGCVTTKLALFSIQQVVCDSTNMLEPGIHSWPFKLQIPFTSSSTSLIQILRKWKGPFCLDMKDKDSTTEIDLPPTTRIRHSNTNRNCDHCFIEYKIQVTGPKVRTNLVFSKPMTAVYPIIINLNTPTLLDTPVLDAPHIFTNQLDEGAGLTDMVSKSSILSQPPFDVCVKFPSIFQLDNPRPFPFVVTAIIPDIAKITTASSPQIDFTDFHLELQAHTEYMTKTDIVRITNHIPLPRYYRPIRYSLEFCETSDKQLIAQFDAGQLIGLNVPGDQGDRKLWPLQSADRENESCPPSFTSWTWRRWYELKFRFTFIWNGGSYHISDGWPYQKHYVIQVLPPSSKVVEAGAVQTKDKAPPTYASLAVTASQSIKSNIEAHKT